MLNDEDLWTKWSEICTSKIAELVPDEYLILMVSDEDNVFVQMARVAESELLFEVSLGTHSNRDSARKSLMDLGWETPGSFIAGPNLQCMWRPDQGDWISLEDATDAAGLIAGTLRYVLGVTDPTRIPVERGNF